MQWEYKTEIRSVYSNQDLLEYLNLEGSSGWELIQHNNTATPMKCVFLFKRALPCKQT